MGLLTAGALIAAPIGALFLLSKFVSLISLLLVYIRPSALSRYAHTFEGKAPWALVTGASGGIGGELVHELAQRGFNVVLHGRSDKKLQVLKATLGEKYPDRDFRTLVIDASKATNAAQFDKIPSVLGDINLTVVINNAGGTTDRTLLTLDRQSPERLLYDASVNALFPMQLIRAMVPLLERNSPGLIINIGSLAEVGVPFGGAYSPGKMFLSRLSELVTLEMKLTGQPIEVLCVKVGNVWGTGQTLAKKPDWLTPDANTMARAVLGRVGCGRRSVAGYWAHALQFAVIGLLPDFLLQRMLIDMAKGLGSQGSKVD